MKRSGQRNEERAMKRQGPKQTRFRVGRGGFVLLEAMLALGVFVFAVLSIARSVEAGLQAGVAQRADVRASRALLNWMRELQAGSVPYNSTPGGVELKGEFAGMRLVQQVEPLQLVDQNNLEVGGMLDVTLTVSWSQGGSWARKQLRFYAYPIGN
jgi:hypothetical protein